jgi:hypothetical protein
VATLLASAVDEDQIVVSDAYNILRGHAALNARAVTADPGDRLTYTAEAISDGCRTGRLWGVAIQHAGRARDGSYGPAIQHLAADPASFGLTAQDGYRVWIGAACPAATARDRLDAGSR